VQHFLAFVVDSRRSPIHVFPAALHITSSDASYKVGSLEKATTVLPMLQQKKSLSAKKTPIRGLKNILGQPFTTSW
jgi:hypothetical protein